MLSRIKLYLKNLDWLLFVSVLLLAIFGLIEIYSIALGQGSADLTDFKKQVFFIILGGMVFTGRHVIPTPSTKPLASLQIFWRALQYSDPWKVTVTACFDQAPGKY